MITSLTAPDFALPQAVLLAHASALAYQAPPLVHTWCAANEFSPPTCFDALETQGFWAEGTDGVALLAFRGTANFAQWLRNARVLPAAHPWGKVHRGFQAGLAGVEHKLVAFDAVAARARHVWLTGHSLGGALAVLAAARLKDKGIESRLLTYGQPMVGLRDFAETFDARLPGRLVRIVNQSDIVPRLPGIGRYSHGGEVKRLAPGSLQLASAAAALAITAEELPPVDEAEYEAVLIEAEANPALLEEGAELQGGYMPFASHFADHQIGEYIRHLENLLPPPRA